MFGYIYLIVGVLLGISFLYIATFLCAMFQRNMHLWMPAYAKQQRLSRGLEFANQGAGASEENLTHIFIAVCDHYEPQRGNAPKDVGISLVKRWADEYPKLFESYRDSNDRPPQHSFFFPQDEYEPEYLDGLKPLCEAGFGDVDIHLHHDGDTEDQLREKLELFREILFERHGFLRKDPKTGEIVYGFIHGNWALCNSRPDGRWCGVDQELTILKETGCYADFTMPSAPSPTQSPIVNSIYYAKDIPGQSCSHFQGMDASTKSVADADHLLMVQGPLLPDWGNRKFGLFPRIENGDLHAGRPADMRRFAMWLKAQVCVVGQPNWKFVKLHTHGCKEGNIETLLGPQTQKFHANLKEYASDNPHIRYHYVTSWEMAQLVHQAEAGLQTPNWEAIMA